MTITCCDLLSDLFFTILAPTELGIVRIKLGCDLLSDLFFTILAPTCS